MYLKQCRFYTLALQILKRSECVCVCVCVGGGGVVKFGERGRDIYMYFFS
mgnify:CR=1 FL=1